MQLLMFTMFMKDLSFKMSMTSIKRMGKKV